ncbi:hypothetical protein E2C01_038890 [Portunus trituberculatus]|uniref:Uncharacterized protein n=1 Tax=Portunus trituberculatus TaxID=210409 RepID=A0A5B7FJ63_PORTR|nr:hypothetical protein [Portunus trituberculatus]
MISFYVFWRVLKTVLRGGRLLLEGSTFPGFQTPASQVDRSQLETSSAMLRLGQTRPAGAADPKVKMVPASATGPTGGFHAPVPGTATPLPKIRRSASTVMRVCDSHLALMPGGHSTTQNTEVTNCHTAPTPGSQTPFQDVEAGVNHMAPMPGNQLIIPSCGLGVAPVPGGSEVGQGLLAPMPVGHPLFTAGTCEDDEEEVSPN